MLYNNENEYTTGSWHNMGESPQTQCHPKAMKSYTWENMMYASFIYSFKGKIHLLIVTAVLKSLPWVEGGDSGRKM